MTASIITREGGRILIVDDNRMNRLKLTRALEEQGHSAAAAENGQQAFDMMRAEAFEVVLLDILMPEMDGYEVLARMKADTALREIPVIVVSAVEEMDSVVRCIEMGAEDYLPKSFDPVLLRARVGTCLEKKRMRTAEQHYMKGLERELEIGREIQSGFLPKTLPQPEGWEIASLFRAARQVAGDFYDGFAFAGGKSIGLVVADVCDKGVGAALYMALFRSLIRATANWGRFAADEHPATRLKAMVALTNDYIAVTHGQANMFATMFFGVLDPASGTLLYINGGQEPPVVVSPNGTQCVLKRTGPPVGAMPDIDFGVEQVHLDPGDLLVAFTDGVTDAKNPDGELFGRERLDAVLTAPAPTAAIMLDRIETALRDHMAEADQFDDITLLAVRRN